MSDGKVTVILPAAPPPPSQPSGAARRRGLPFPTGNQLWKLREFHGRPRLYTDGAVLWEEAKAYFEWCDAHPILRPELVKYQGDAHEEYISVSRPYTMEGLTVFLQISKAYFRGVKNVLGEKQEKGTITEQEEGILHAVHIIEGIVRTQQIEGALVFAYNPMLVARLQGLVENTQGTNTGETILRIEVRDQQTADNMQTLEGML